MDSIEANGGIEVAGHAETRQSENEKAGKERTDRLKRRGGVKKETNADVRNDADRDSGMEHGGTL